MSGRGAFTEGRRFSADDQARVSWRVDPWDDPDEVPVVERPPRRGLLLRWVVGLVAATLIANRVDADHPAIERRMARTLDDDSDLGDLPVTVAVGPLPADIVADLEREGR